MTTPDASTVADMTPDGVRKLAATDVRWTCDPKDLSFETTADLKAPDALIGQARAERSLEFGVDIQRKGFNIYAAGSPGTGRVSMIVERLQHEASDRPAPDDWCYAYNFDDQHRPKALRLPAGKAPVFGAQMDELVETLRQDMPQAFETEQYRNQRDHITRRIEENRRERFRVIEQQAAEAGFGLVQSPAGLSVAPVAEGQPLSADALNAMSPKDREVLQRTGKVLEDELEQTMRALRALQKDARRSLTDLSRDVARSVARPLLDDLREEYVGVVDVLSHFDAVEAHVTTKHMSFLEPDKVNAPPEQKPGSMGDPFVEYRINVLVTHQPSVGAPLVREGHPVHLNLFGHVEARSESGVMVTDHTMIKPGALHRANGGYLVLEAEELLQASVSYQALKRALRDQLIRMDGAARELGRPSVARLDPDPIELDVKVALVGGPDTYAMLYDFDPDFGELFKVLAEFETEISRDDDNIIRYAQFIAARCSAEGLLPFDRAAVARVLEEAVRLAQDRSKLSTRFGDISDIVREAEYWARRRGGDLVTEEDVRTSVYERSRRSDLMEVKIRERVSDGTVMIDVQGSEVGQVNGLSVLAIGGHEFGQASRITARVFSGRDGVISIDREVKLSGPIHDKGAMILAGFMNGTFGASGPLAMSATIVFEQMYGGVDGDSASLAELLVLLSALADYPLSQAIAVTGSVNQHGEVQAVGGVTHKIEGFYDLCATDGLTGAQGALIPASNVRHLTLRWDVAQAIAEGRFHVYAATTVAGAAELLMGRPAGVVDTTGRFPRSTVFGETQVRLAQFARRWHDGPPH